MPNRKGPDTHHVLPAPEGGWDVRRGGAERVWRHFDTKAEAVECGRDVSRGQGTELRIHNRDGRIAGSDSHGHDPRDVRG